MRGAERFFRYRSLRRAPNETKRVCLDGPSALVCRSGPRIGSGGFGHAQRVLARIDSSSARTRLDCAVGARAQRPAFTTLDPRPGRRNRHLSSPGRPRSHVRRIRAAYRSEAKRCDGCVSMPPASVPLRRSPFPFAWPDIGECTGGRIRAFGIRREPPKRLHSAGAKVWRTCERRPTADLWGFPAASIGHRGVGLVFVDEQKQNRTGKADSERPKQLLLAARF
jgi:hypothetical protein